MKTILCDVCGLAIGGDEVRVAVSIQVTGKGWSLEPLLDGVRTQLDLYKSCFTRELLPFIQQLPGREELG